MNLAEKAKIETLTHTVMIVGRVFSRMSDENLLRVMRTARRLLGDPAMREGFDEVVDAFASGPPNSTLLRRMIKESKYDELRDMMFGTFCFKEIDLEDL